MKIGNLLRRLGKSSRRELNFVLLLSWLLLSHDAAAERLGVWNEKAAAAWWDNYLDADAWLAGGEALQTALITAQESYGVERALTNAHFMKWVMHRRWLSLFPKTYADDEFFNDELNRKQFAKLGRKSDLLALVSGTLLPSDDGSRVAEALCRIELARPNDFDEYVNLAIALAVVGDSLPPEGWPHPYVSRDAIPIGDRDPAARFAFYVDAHRAGELLLDPRKLSVRELCFVVDTLVELRELKYAQQIKLGTPRKLEDLYFGIKYDEGRIQTQKYQWPHGAYHLIDVGKKGGICADQAYFVSHAGKAKGVPTVVFIGQGVSGTHAWVGFMQKTGSWEFEAARFRGEKYPVGIAYDPQTWKRVTDVQLAAAIKDTGSGKALEKSRQKLQWAMLNEGAEFYPEVLKIARRDMPRAVVSWEMEAAWLAEKVPDKQLHVRFWQNWVQTFDRERDLKIRGQKNLLRVFEEMGNTRDAERLRDRVVAENRSARFDLGISLAADTVLAEIAKRDWEAAEDEYEKVMRRFKRKAGGHLFYNLVQPYVTSCLQEGQFKLAEDAVKNLAKDFDAQKGSILDNDLRKLVSTVEGAR